MSEIRKLNIAPEEVEAGKAMAIIAYFIFFVPLLVEDARKNRFAMYHTEQAILLMILYFASIIIGGVIGMVTCGIGFILFLVPLAGLVIGIINAVQGNAKPLPVIGQYGEKFNLVKNAEAAQLKGKD